ncbi:c-type cytochrome [Ilumatobacter sp.]|uniref:cytochrome bc1 complex diheme cytochrome c subunit n=1 Tax=Ilumatobacter sp. TaxID=1967498 RepID=UPI003C36E5E4
MSAVLRSPKLALLPLAAAIVFALVMLLASGPATGAPRAAGDVGSEEADGALMFKTQCSSCHGLDGLGVENRGPSLESEGAAAADFVLRTGRMPLAAPNLQAKSGPVRYSEAEIVALVDHVATIGGGPGIPDVDTTNADVTNGGTLFRLNCAACHVASGAGAPIGSGRIAPNLVDATPTEVGEAIIVGPGSMPIFGEFSPEDINDVAAYIETALTDADTTSARHFGGAGPVAEGLAAWLLALIPLVALTRWIGRPSEGRHNPQTEAERAEAERPMETDQSTEVAST